MSRGELIRNMRKLLNVLDWIGKLFCRLIVRIQLNSLRNIIDLISEINNLNSETNNVSLQIIHCSDVALFELGSVFYSQYLINLQLPQRDGHNADLPRITGIEITVR